MARRGEKYSPDETMRGQVTTMAGYGVPHEQIATVMGINKTTLYDHYRKELDLGMARANINIGKSLYEQAVGRPAEYQGRKRLRDELKPDRSVSIFLGKARLGMKDTQYVGITLEDLDLSKLSDEEAEQLAQLVRKANKATPDTDGSGSGGKG